MARRPRPGGLGGLHWAGLLGFALLAPTALPAGGGERRLPQVRRRESASEPLLSLGCEALRCAPRQEAPTLLQLERGVPLRVLRSWSAVSGGRWLQVELQPATGRTRRGWLAD
ncbi:MAG: SH3 domain-containing protein [Cyanobacteriota bacterium]|nr:SH3 domain-containing protein [Cyanobacteriota bacterium]